MISIVIPRITSRIRSQVQSYRSARCFDRRASSRLRSSLSTTARANATGAQVERPALGSSHMCTISAYGRSLKDGIAASKL